MTQKQLKAIGIGEILWDIFPEGKKLGGAPSNFAFHVNQLGIQSAVISATGSDEPGLEIQEIIGNSEILKFINTNDNPTGTVGVELDNKGTPAYIIHENVAWDYIDPAPEAIKYAAGAQAICFGSLAQRSDQSRKSIQKILHTAPESALRVFDINLRQQFYNKDIILQSLEQANILKINEEEIGILAEMAGMTGDEFGLVDKILKKFNLDYLALTKGNKGSWLVSRNEQSFIETPEVKVVDTVGAGDSFTAAMVAGFLNNKPLKEVHQLAVDVSAYVCTQEGATPALPDDLRQLF